MKPSYFVCHSWPMTEFYVSLPCKPYVKRFLEINFGDPVDLSADQRLKKMFVSMLRKPNTRYDNNMGKMNIRYSETIDVLISEDIFYRHGWELTKTDTVNFGREIEDRAKLLMRNTVALNLAVTGSIKVGISRFQDRFGFSEDVWPAESIKKDFYRNGQHEIIDFEKEIFQKIEKLILVSLSGLGTISQKAHKHYEKQFQTAG